MKRYIVWMSFEANIDIEAKSEDEALERASTLLQWNRVVNDETGETNHDFVSQEPHIVETHEL